MVAELKKMSSMNSEKTQIPEFDSTQKDKLVQLKTFTPIDPIRT